MYRDRKYNAYYEDGEMYTDRGDFDNTQDYYDERFSRQNANRRSLRGEFNEIGFAQRGDMRDEAFFQDAYDSHGRRFDDYLHPVSSQRYRDRQHYSDYERPEALIIGNTENSRHDQRYSGERIEIVDINPGERYSTGRNGDRRPDYYTETGRNGDRRPDYYSETGRNGYEKDNRFQDYNEYYENSRHMTGDFEQRAAHVISPRREDQRSDVRRNQNSNVGQVDKVGNVDDPHVVDTGHDNLGYEIDKEYENYRPKLHRGISLRRRSRKSRRENRQELESDQRISFADGMKTIIQRRKSIHTQRPLSELGFRSRLSRPGSVFGSSSNDGDEDDEDKLPSSKYHKRRSLKHRLATLQKQRPVTSHDMATLLRDQVLTREASNLKGWTLQKYQLSMQWQRFKNWIKSWVYELELWAGAFKVIEGHFGTSTVSYFRFLRWLMYLNLFMTVFMFTIVLLPFLLLEPKGDGSFTASVNACSSIFHNEAVFYSSNYTTSLKREVEGSSTADKIQDVLQGTGWMEHTVLFYGVFYSKKGYNMSLAYLCAVGVSFLLCFILLVKNSAKGFKQSATASVGGNITMYCNRVFGAWDYCISESETARLKHVNILQEIKNEMEYQRLQWKKASRTTKEKFKLYSIRALINILVVVILGGALYLIYFANQKLVELEKTNSLSEAVALIMQFLPSITIMLLSVIVPTLFNKLVIVEDYMPAFAIRITLIRTVLLRLASIGILMISLYTTLQPKKKNLGVLIPCDNLTPPSYLDNTTTPASTTIPYTGTTSFTNTTESAADTDTDTDNILCWETYFGQQIYKLVMLNFLVVILVTFGWEFPRKFIHKKLHRKLKVVELMGQQTFDLSKNVLDLVYLQTLCWLGVFFSPIIPAMCFVKCFVFFYVKKGSLLTNCLPMQQYGTTKSNSLFMMVLLLSFFLASIPIIYMIGSIPPSQGCGPFRVYSSADYIMFDTITNLVETSHEAKDVFSVVATPAFMTVIAFCLCLLMYYFWIVGQANYNLSKSLREQLKVEGHDKQFLVARVNEAYARDFQ